MAYWISQFLFYGFPIAAVLFFIISLVLYIKEKRENKDVEKVKIYRTMLIISGTILGTLIVVVILIVCLLFTAVAFM